MLTAFEAVCSTLYKLIVKIDIKCIFSNELWLTRMLLRLAVRLSSNATCMPGTVWVRRDVWANNLAIRKVEC